MTSLNSKLQRIHIHKSSDIQSHKIGDGTSIWQFCVVLPQASIGKNCNICSHVFIENDVVIGDNVTVKCGVQLWDGLRVEDDVFIGPNVTFTNDKYPRSKIKLEKFSRTSVGKNVSIGANATIIAGIHIGDYALIGAGAVVTRDVPKHGLVYGNPAKLHGYVCDCAQRLNSELICHACKKSYQLIEDQLSLEASKIYG